MLQFLFVEILQKTGFQEREILVKWAGIEKSYTHKKRYYHNLIHLEKMFGSYEKYNQFLDNPTEIALAIFYHDLVYDVTNKNNELKSAELALKELNNSKSIDLQMIYDLILSTKNHQATTNNQKWMIDFDLQILGSDWETYQKYAQQIRKEYGIYPDLLYNPGRKKALKHFLIQSTIFQTEIFQNQFENQARKNIKQEIKLL